MSHLNKIPEECPCYTCVVQACCIGAEPSLKEKERWETPEYQKELNECGKEHDQMHDEIEALENKWNINLSLSWSFNDEDYSIPEIDAQLDCNLYCEWSGIDLDELDRLEKITEDLL